jgi:D-sedoheptulose 7-phosphate isomerase
MSPGGSSIDELLARSASNLAGLRVHSETIREIAARIVDALRLGGTLFLCGNGGSAAQAQHIAAEFTGRFKLERRGLRAVSLTTDTSALTAIGNDYGFENVFARQIEALGLPGDVLLGLSTSGGSKNVLRAFEKARECGVGCIALTGPTGGAIAELADATLAAPGESTANVQECHLAALHVVCEIAERELSD